MRSMSKRAMLPAAAALMIGTLLAGCSSGGNDGDLSGGKESTSAPATSASAAPVDGAALAKAMDKLVYHGTDQKSPDGGSCFVQAVRSDGVTEAGLAHVVEADSDDLGALADGMWKEFPVDAAVLASPELRGDLDNCKDQAAPTPSDGKKKDDGRTYEPPKPGEDPEAGKKPNLKPKYEVREDAKITSASQLKDGLVSMFSSFAADEKQEKTYAAAGECLSGVVWKADLSQESLRFLAGGAPIGTGSVAEHLPNEKDRDKWESKEFSTGLMDCTLGVDPKDIEGS